jgi:hypothetical protein
MDQIDSLDSAGQIARLKTENLKRSDQLRRAMLVAIFRLVGKGNVDAKIWWGQLDATPDEYRYG